MGKNLFEKVWELHTVKILPNGQTQLFIDTHFIHEVTSPQAFGMLRNLKLEVMYPERTFATVDHIIPTDFPERPFKDELAEQMISEIEKNCKDNNIRYFGRNTGEQGIVHVVGPEKGLTQPGMTIACGDSHTATHGAFGAIAFGIGTSQVRDLLATQTMALKKYKVRKINIEGKFKVGVYAKDLILHIIRLLGVNGGLGYAYEYTGSIIRNMSVEERMTVCNMSIEGGARVGYINPDEETFEYLKGKEFAPKGKDWEKAVEAWKSYASDPDATYDDVVNINAEDIEPSLTWGINPAQTVFINENLPSLNAETQEAFEYMKLEPEKPIKATKINIAFIGSCTNGRLSDFEEVAKYIKGKKISPSVRGLVVPGSMEVKRLAEQKGLDKIFIEAGFEWREAGCSMCLAMNPDKLIGDQICASSSNRNFKGRQGSPSGRTLLMSPVMVAASAIAGEVADPREIFEIK